MRRRRGSARSYPALRSARTIFIFYIFSLFCPFDQARGGPGGEYSSNGTVHCLCSLQFIACVRCFCSFRRQTRIRGRGEPGASSHRCPGAPCTTRPCLERGFNTAQTASVSIASRVPYLQRAPLWSEVAVEQFRLSTLFSRQKHASASVVPRQGRAGSRRAGARRARRRGEQGTAGGRARCAVGSRRRAARLNRRRHA